MSKEIDNISTLERILNQYPELDTPLYREAYRKQEEGIPPREISKVKQRLSEIFILGSTSTAAALALSACQPVRAIFQTPTVEEPTVKPSPSPSEVLPSPTRSPTRTPTRVSTETPTLTPSPTETSSPTLTSTVSPTETATPFPTETPTRTPTKTATPEPTATFTPSPEPTPEFRGLDLEGLKEIWDPETQRWEYLDVDNQSVAYWDQEANEGEGKVEFIDGVGKKLELPKHEGLVRRVSNQEMEQFVQKARENGDWRVPILFKLPEGEEEMVLENWEHDRGPFVKVKVPVGTLVVAPSEREYIVLATTSRGAKIIEFWKDAHDDKGIISIGMNPDGEFLLQRGGNVPSGTPLLRVESLEKMPKYDTGEGDWPVVIVIYDTNNESIKKVFLTDEQGFFLAFK